MSRHQNKAGRIASLIVAGTLVLGVSACGDDEADEVESELENEADEVESELDEVEDELDEVESQVQD